MTVPSLVPILSAGRHAGPEQGGCFMEVASLLAGERWTDHPRSVHPGLGVVARAVNDAASDAGRPALAPLVPLALGTAGADDRVIAELTVRCVERALGHADPVERLLLGRTLRRCARVRTELAPSGRWRRRVRRWRLLAVASRAVPRCVLLVAERGGPEPDAELRALLADAVAATRRAAVLPETAADAATPEAWARAGAVVGTAGG